MTNRNVEYSDALDTYEEAQLDIYVSELLTALNTMKSSVKQTDSGVILLSWVEETVIRLANDFKNN